MKDIIIVGAGVVGSFIARSLSRYKLDILVIDRENDVGNVTSMANSAIAHSGYDPEPGSKKAYFNVRGNRMMKQVCQELDAPFVECGTMTVAIEDEQIPMLQELLERAKKNDVPATLLSAEEVKKMEPNINPDVKAALLCPTGGLIDPFLLCSHAMENAVDNGVELHLAEELLSIERQEEHFKVHTSKGDYECRIFINAAGLHSDEVARMVEDVPWTINPRKGEYYVLNHLGDPIVNHVLFPLPSSKGKGILVTRTTGGTYLVGPSSEWSEDKDDFSCDSPTLKNVAAQAKTLVPSLPMQDSIRVFSGLRATPSTHDFIIEESQKVKGFINVAGIESPGLVSSPAIGEYVADTIVSSIIKLEKKEDYNPYIKPYVHPLELTEEQQAELIKKNPHYGQIVCACEKITLGEIEDVLSRSVPANTVKAIKKRTRARFGRCQGWYCTPKILNLIAKKTGKSPLEINYDRDGSALCMSCTKEGAHYD